VIWPDTTRGFLYSIYTMQRQREDGAMLPT
jgi:hypothetical protein